MKYTFLLLGLLVFAAATPRASATSIGELRQKMLEVNPEGSELTLQFDPEKKLLKFGRKIPVNPQRFIIQTQSVALKHLEPQASLDQIGSRFQPWVKLRCRGGRNRVQINEQVFVDGEEIELESTEAYHPVLVIPCDIYRLEEFANAVTSFLENNR